MNTVRGFADTGSETVPPATIEEGTLVEELIPLEEPTLSDVLKKRLANLLSVKSLVTLILTFVFAYQAINKAISQDFITIYAVIIAFYFGTQSKTESTNKGDAQ